MKVFFGESCDKFVFERVVDEESGDAAGWCVYIDDSFGVDAENGEDFTDLAGWGAFGCG